MCSKFGFVDDQSTGLGKSSKRVHKGRIGCMNMMFSCHSDGMVNCCDTQSELKWMKNAPPMCTRLVASLPAFVVAILHSSQCMPGQVSKVDDSVFFKKQTKKVNAQPVTDNSLRSLGSSNPNAKRMGCRDQLLGLHHAPEDG